jgi:mannose-1-phosphate guanylyltransferase
MSSPLPPSDLTRSPHVVGAILSAGRGTRMRELSHALPKPLLPVAGRPLISWSLLALERAGVREVGVNTFHLGEQLKEALAEREPSIVWSDELELQGTGGGARDLWRALCSQHRQPLQQPTAMLILNGDAWFDFDLAPLLTAHQRSPRREATLALRATTYDDPFGRVGLDARGQVVRIAEIKGPRASDEVSVGAFLGAQVISPHIAEAIPNEPCDLFRSAYRERLAQGAEVGAYLVPQESLWVDVGTPERYVELHMTLLERLASERLSEALQRALPPHTLFKGAGGLVLVQEGAQRSPHAQLKRGAWLYPHAELGAVSAESLVV